METPDVATEAGTGTRGSGWRRRILWASAFLAVAILATLAVVYNHQLRAFGTHTVGPPEHTFELVPFPPGAQPDLRLAFAGDIGDGGDLEWRTAATMYAAGRNDRYDVLALLGDNVYPDGDPELLEEYVFLPFAAVLDGGAELFAVAGNHDAIQPDGGLDQLHALGMPGLWWAQELGDVLLVGLDSNQVDNAGQLAWLDETLSNSEATWKIVTLHHPPYSAGYHGSSRDARDAFTPIFDKYGVQLVLSGHEHDYQRSVPINGVTYVVAGGAAGSRPTGIEEYTAYSTSTPHFVEVNVFADRLVLRAIDHAVRLIDEVVIPR